MSSKITTIYNAIVTELGTIFPSKTRIPNAYDLENNPFNMLVDGYGLRIDDSSLYRPVLRTSGQARSFTVIITRQVVRTDTNATIIDTEAKAILEDANTLILSMEDSDQINANSSIDRIDFSGSSGIELLGASRSQFISVEVTFNVQYKETLS
jgi:hypothetical protein